MNLRDYLKSIKPAIVGSIMVFIGIFLSRKGISIEIFTASVMFGPIAYLFLALSGIIIIKILQIIENPSSDNRFSIKQAKIIFGVTYLIGLMLAIISIIISSTIYHLNIFILVFAVSLGILWALLGYYAFKIKINSDLIKSIIRCLVFSLGILYGALLITRLIPLFVYFFFLTASFLQLSRELIKDLPKRDQAEREVIFKRGDDIYNSLKSSLVLQFLAITFFILPIFTNIAFPLLYLFFMVVDLIIIGLASVLILKSISERKMFNIIGLLLKIGILIELITFIVIGS